MEMKKFKKNIIYNSLKDTYRFALEKKEIFIIGFMYFIVMISYTIIITEIMRYFFNFPFNWDIYSIRYIVDKGLIHIISLFFIIILDIFIFYPIGAFFLAIFFNFIKNCNLRESLTISLILKFFQRLFFLQIAISIFSLVVFIITLIPLSLIYVTMISVFPESKFIIIPIIMLLVSFIILSILLRPIFSIPIVVYEDKDVLESIRESWYLTDNYFMEMLTTVSFFISFIFTANIFAMFINSFIRIPLLYPVLNYSVITPLICILIAFLYFNIKGKNAS